MRIRSIVITVTLVATGMFGVVYAQQEHDHVMPAAAGRATTAGEHPPEVFCGTMKTGQLCSNGTVTLFGLTADKRDAWLAAVREYNKAVNTAITALQAQAKTNLSAAQVAEVNRWFAIGINPQINQLLAADNAAVRK
jgi:hypothetical protein